MNMIYTELFWNTLKKFIEIDLKNNIQGIAMKAFKRWMRNWLRDDENIVAEQYANRPMGRVTKISSDSSRGSTTFRLISAQGGKVIEASHWDPKTDRENITVYVVSDDEDLTESFGKIITMESLK
jgi:hypothetical protein